LVLGVAGEADDLAALVDPHAVALAWRPVASMVV
jgi:hypothetical protein